jgi:hypothetical protein
MRLDQKTIYKQTLLRCLSINSVFQSVIPEVLNRESSVFKGLYIPGSSPRMTNLYFMDRLYLVLTAYLLFHTGGE